MLMFRNKFTEKIQNKVNIDKYNFINLETKENIEKKILKKQKNLLINIYYQ